MAEKYECLICFEMFDIAQIVIAADCLHISCKLCHYDQKEGVDGSFKCGVCKAETQAVSEAPVDVSDLILKLDRARAVLSQNYENIYGLYNYLNILAKAMGRKPATLHFIKIFKLEMDELETHITTTDYQLPLLKHGSNDYKRMIYASICERIVKLDEIAQRTICLYNRPLQDNITLDIISSFPFSENPILKKIEIIKKSNFSIYIVFVSYYVEGRHRIYVVPDRRKDRYQIIFDNVLIPFGPGLAIYVNWTLIAYVTYDNGVFFTS